MIFEITMGYIFHDEGKGFLNIPCSKGASICLIMQDHVLSYILYLNTLLSLGNDQRGA